MCVCALPFTEFGCGLQLTGDWPAPHRLSSTSIADPLSSSTSSFDNPLSSSTSSFDNPLSSSTSSFYNPLMNSTTSFREPLRLEDQTNHWRARPTRAPSVSDV